MEENLHIRFGSAFLYMTPEAQATNRKIVTYQIKNLFITGHFWKSEKPAHRMGENIWINHISDDRLISRIY